MLEKKYQIFISSTFADLKDERQAIMNSIIDLRHVPLGMEGFPAIDEEQMNYIRRLIDECDYYIVLISNRYGSTDGRGISFTEQEYDYAVETGKHVLAFINNEGKTSDCDAPEQLASFKKKVSTGRIIKNWSTRASLEVSVVKSLSAAFEADPKEGWVRAAAAADPKIYQELEGARKRIAELEAMVNPPVVVENLAGLDHEVTIPYTYTTYYRGSTETHKASFTLALREIFMAVGNTYRTSKVESVFETEMKHYLAFKNIPSHGLDIVQQYRIQILNQFELLGLMTSQELQAVNGGYHVYYQVTLKGAALLKAGLAITV